MMEKKENHFSSLSISRYIDKMKYKRNVLLMYTKRNNTDIGIIFSKLVVFEMYAGSLIISGLASKWIISEGSMINK